VYGIVQQYGITGLAIATFIAGVILVVMGFLKLGTIIKFIPYPVVVGFTSGIALTIFATQVKDFLGLHIERMPADFIQKWIEYVKNISTINVWALLVGIFTILIITLTPKITKKIPGSLIAIIAMTALVYLLRTKFGINNIETIGDIFNIAQKPLLNSCNQF
jgi:SulP family sulfate permease